MHGRRLLVPQAKLFSFAYLRSMLKVAAFLKEKLRIVPEAPIPKLRGYYVAKIQLDRSGGSQTKAREFQASPAGFLLSLASKVRFSEPRGEALPRFSVPESRLS